MKGTNLTSKHLGWKHQSSPGMSKFLCTFISILEGLFVAKYLRFICATTCIQCNNSCIDFKSCVPSPSLSMSRLKGNISKHSANQRSEPSTPGEAIGTYRTRRQKLHGQSLRMRLLQTESCGETRGLRLVWHTGHRTAVALMKTIHLIKADKRSVNTKLPT